MKIKKKHIILMVALLSPLATIGGNTTVENIESYELITD